jgi:hypothetical protein
MKTDIVKLCTARNGAAMDFVEVSVTGAARHAVSIMDQREGCVHGIEVNGETVWCFQEGRDSLGELDELAKAVAVS